MTDLDRLATLDGISQAEMVRNKELQPIDLVEAAIDRIQQLNPELNAIITPMFDLARAEAAKALPEGPFAGVPFVLKDLIAEYEGTPLSEGSAYLNRQYLPRGDSELVHRQKQSGLICVGKANASEFGLVPTTEPHLFGPTRNPWDTSRTSGGSSGGPAAAVASGMVPLAHANDGGGSIRIPASCCGVFGLKPTRGRNPLGPHYGDIVSGIIAEHAVTRSVRDSAALLDATAGPDLGDPYAAPPPQRPFLEEVGADPGRLRIAFSAKPLTGLAVHADCVASVRDAADFCEGLGHDVEEASPSVDGALMVKRFGHVWLGGVGWAIRDWERRTGRKPTAEHFEPLTWRMFEIEQQMKPSDYLLAIQDLQQLSREVARFFDSYDLWLTPTLAQPPVPLGYFDYTPEDVPGFQERLGQYTHFTLVCNVTGQPAMSVPLYWNAEGLPIGTQFIGRFGEEATLFRIAAQLEAARPWADRRPPFPE